MSESYLFVYVEDGEFYPDEGGGDWYTEKRFQAVRDCSPEIEEGLSEEQEVQARIKASDKPFWVKLTDCGWFSTPPGWDIDYGFCPGDYGITWEKAIIREEEMPE